MGNLKKIYDAAQMVAMSRSVDQYLKRVKYIGYYSEITAV